MKYRTRTYYTDAQKALMWERWKEGWTLHQIAHLFDRAHGSIRGIFERTGGFRPPQRSRSPIALTLAEREEISRSVAEGRSIRSTAARLGLARSTVSREIRRNGGQGNYRATEAPRRLGAGAASQVLQTSREQNSGADRDRQAPAAMVTRTDRRMAQACSVRPQPTNIKARVKFCGPRR
jgi:IS30 family transposase